MVTKHEYLEKNEFETVIGSDMKFTGKIESQEPNLIKGTLSDCHVNATLLVVVDEGWLSGVIESNILTVLGTCEGELIINDTLTIPKGGNIDGKVRTNTLVIGEGGILNGECNMQHRKVSQE